MASYYQSSHYSSSSYAPRQKDVVQAHMGKVYTTLLAASLSATAGAWAYMNRVLPTSGLTTFASFGVLIWLLATRPEPANMSKRLMLLLAFAFLQGLSVGPLASFAEFIEPGILFDALLGTAVVFGTFSLSVLLAPNVGFLALGGFLFSGLNLLLVLSFANIFIGSMGVFQFELYFGLVLFSGFVAYDTQKMITKAEQGSRDYVLHALELFQDAFSIFVRILNILMRNRESDRRRENRRRE